MQKCGIFFIIVHVKNIAVLCLKYFLSFLWSIHIKYDGPENFVCKFIEYIVFIFKKKNHDNPTHSNPFIYFS